MSEQNTKQGASGLAIAGLVLGILAAVSSWIPIINNFSFVLALIGAVFAVVGVVSAVRGTRGGKGLAIAALVVNVVAIGIVLATQSAMSAAIDEATSSPEVSSVSTSGEGADAAADAASDQGDAAADQGTTDLAPGTSVTLEGGLTVSVDSVETGLANYDGTELIGVQVTYVNNGDEQADYNTYDWKGEDADGAQEYGTYYSEAADDLGSGTLAAGGTKSGTIYFEGGTVKVLYFGNLLSDAPSASWTVA